MLSCAFLTISEYLFYRSPQFWILLKKLFRAFVNDSFFAKNCNHFKQKKIAESRNFGLSVNCFQWNTTVNQLTDCYHSCHERRPDNAINNILPFLSDALSPFKLIMWFRSRRKLIIFLSTELSLTFFVHNISPKYVWIILIHLFQFSPVLYFIQKPVIWFAVQIKSGFYVKYNTVLKWFEYREPREKKIKSIEVTVRRCSSRYVFLQVL